jgi:branched-chain amino acid transport system substrate-binding protein
MRGRNALKSAGEVMGARKLKPAILAVLLSLFANLATAQEELKIGAIGPLSGGGTAWGLAVQRGAEMAIDEINKAGGLHIGDTIYRPRLIMYDDQYTAAGGRTAVERLINLDGVKYIVGPIGSPSALAVVPVTTKAKVIVLSDGYAPEILKNASGSPYNFRTMNSNVEFGPAMVKWLRERHPEIKKVALIVSNDATGQAVLPTLGEFYKANGFAVWSESYERGTKEFTPLLTRMLAQDVDLLDLNSNAPGEAGLLLKQARQVGFKKMIWQVGGPSVDEVVAIAGALANGFVSYDVFDFNEPSANAFVSTYRARWSGVINAQTPGWYNTTKILFKALQEAGSLDTDRVRDALVKIEGYDAGIYGPARWGGQGDYGVAHQLLNKFWITEVKDRKPNALTVLTPEQK